MKSQGGNKEKPKQNGTLFGGIKLCCVATVTVRYFEPVY